MNVIIERYITDQDMNEYNALIHRPRVSFQISEYIWNHIYANCLKSYQIIMDEFMYHINLWFILYDEKGIMRLLTPLIIGSVLIFVHYLILEL